MHTKFTRPMVEAKYASRAAIAPRPMFEATICMRWFDLNSGEDGEKCCTCITSISKES